MNPEYQAVIKTVPAAAPGIATVVADWAGLINTVASTAFLTASLAFLLWRWRVAYVKEKADKDDDT